MERTAGPVLDAAVGDRLAVAGPSGTTTEVRISGTVYDAALAPAGQESTGYGYLTPAGLARLGFTASADEMRIVTAERDETTVAATATGVAEWLTAQGREVHLIQAPPYQQHHSQSETITGMFLAFAVAALVLAGVLVAATLGAMLAAQTRQIGIMKTVGATTGQLLRVYLGAVAAIAATATVLAVGPALLAAGGAMFTSGLNSSAAWRSWVDDRMARRAYDVQLRLAAPASVDTITRAARVDDGVIAVEPFVSLPATPASADGQIEVERTYPDDGHGRFLLAALPVPTRRVDFEVTAGRWLKAADTDGVVLNQSAVSRLGDPRVGDEVHLAVDGVVGRRRLVGTVAEAGGPATAYTSPQSVTRFVDPGTANMLHIVTAGDTAAVTGAVEGALTSAGLAVDESMRPRTCARRSTNTSPSSSVPCSHSPR
ncbi:FtsX-like permease family protein [Micromonospora sp. NPDC000442]|uniref:FtsX-like permease family protein n=1 Tax=Micromonospora sp. NPDC000442 TaxID=3364217 RepID=UPI0036BF02D8